jgi:hypothetical protein
MEALFKTVFFFAILVFCVLIIGLFLLFVKILLLFNDQVQMLGITMT